MKKIFLFVAFAMMVSVANAWHKNCDAGVVALAAKHLTPEAKALVEKHLGTTYEDDVHHLYLLEKKKKASFSKEIHYLHLDSQLQPMKVEGDDALVALEEALTVVAAYETRSDEEVTLALRTVINLMSDIHHISNYRLAAIPYSQDTYTISRRTYDYGKEKGEITKSRWQRMWGGFSKRYSGFSGEFWAYDMNLGRGKMKEEYSKGTPREWAVEVGAISTSYLNKFTPDYVLTPFEYNSLEEVNYDMMARASFRLAAVLNSTIK
jgi:hypothetical protein